MAAEMKPMEKLKTVTFCFKLSVFSFLYVPPTAMIRASTIILLIINTMVQPAIGPQ